MIPRRGRGSRWPGAALWLLLGAAVLCGADAGPAAARSPRRVTLDADSTNVAGVLEQLAVRSGLNIVTAGDVGDRRISVRLQNTPVAEALDVVVKAAGLSYERIGSSIVVTAPQEQNVSSGGTARVFHLRYADAEDARRMLEVVTKEASADPAGNRLVVHAAPALMEQVAGVLAEIDRKPEQVLLEARLIEVNTSALQEIGVDWEKITKLSALVTEGYHGRSERGSFPSEMGYLKASESDIFFRQAHSFEVAIDALLTQGRARLLANSRVMTVDGQAAEIFAGETVPVVITSLQSPGGGGGVLQTVQLEKIDVGVKLRIVPRVAVDRTITTLVEPEVSRITGFRGPDNDLPQTSTRRARTLVRVKEGQKIYLGGLISEEHRRTEKRVPILGSLPWVGSVFRYTRDDTAQTDLVIEITPRIVGDEGNPPDTELPGRE